MTFDRWTYAARIVSVHDGDTVRAEVDLGFEVRVTMTLRLFGIQAPEVAGPGVTPAEKAAGAAARDWLDEALLAAPPGFLFVRTEHDKSNDRDKAEGRGRYLATLLVGSPIPGVETVNLNARMLAIGHAIAAPLDGAKVPKWVAPARWRLADGTEVTTPPP